MNKPRAIVTRNGCKLTLFYGGPFSNFWKCHRLEIGGHKYLCTEQYYMYRKALAFNDLQAANAILKAQSPKVMKAIGRRVKNFNRKRWTKESIEVMIEANVHKYLQNERLRRTLEGCAGSIMAEASPTDLIWGIGYGLCDSRSRDPGKWRGTNLLGRILQEIRDCILSRQWSDTETLISIVKSKFE